MHSDHHLSLPPSSPHNARRPGTGCAVPGAVTSSPATAVTVNTRDFSDLPSPNHNLTEADGSLLKKICSTVTSMSAPAGDLPAIMLRQLGLHALWCYEHADRRPPITAESLTELDMPRIINNPKLRHDVNFDRELHFRPNLDGSRGRHKLLQAEYFWTALEAELAMYRLAWTHMAEAPAESDYWEQIMRASVARLPDVFVSVRDILKTLVPEQDQQTVVEHLDKDFLMQQILKGVCDLVALGDWLARILKSHCAPMRDPLVNSMQQEIHCGATEDRPDKLVSGLRQLLLILEAMKLDVANHQIRHMRPLLIQDTISFNRRYNAHRIAAGKTVPCQSRVWLQAEMSPLSHCTVSHPEALASALLKGLLLFDAAAMCPPTFYLDYDRLRALRLEMHALVYRNICREVLQETAHCLQLNKTQLLRSDAMLQTALTDIVGVHGKFTERHDSIALELLRTVSVVDDRYSPLDSDLLSMVEEKLSDRLRFDSPAFKRSATLLQLHMCPRLQTRVRDNIRLSTFDLQEKFVPPTSSSSSSRRVTLGYGAICAPPPPPISSSSATFPSKTTTPRNSESPSPEPVEDLLRRLTHILVLHWQIWAELVYLADPLADSSPVLRSAAPSVPNPTNPSPTTLHPPRPHPPTLSLPAAALQTETYASASASGLPTPAASPQPQPARGARHPPPPPSRQPAAKPTPSQTTHPPPPPPQPSPAVAAAAEGSSSATASSAPEQARVGNCGNNGSASSPPPAAQHPSRNSRR